ncbi:helicase-related protein [Planosporangium mesophilum]|uniref:ATP-dependent DNA helicase RecQ n=1 Tax=Planosporangium mesophilum TaxID=689768 RepID=A0A8J3TBG7_9ACTN|nr:helicase-related protein [Planosporangium mesophilum]NJC82677.1 ATP-dependent DNA helicase RecQ [Planosporangium mesophilum]GII21824.1 ATP-dependent DNA helicase RecQ [Planosporangium mesophilum]
MTVSLLPNSIRLRRAARRHFGCGLCGEQLAAARAVLNGRDALVVMPAGPRRSAGYRVPATLLPGPTVVISPRADRAAPADGPTRLLFVTPEQLGRPERLAELRALRPSLVAVEFAHCVSAFGHDFRPDYLPLGRLVRDLGSPPVIALTETASPPVREDIVARLRLRDPKLVVAGLDRPNLYLEAVGCAGEEDRWRRLLTRLRAAEGAGIAYVPTRRAAEDLAERLVGEGVAASAYHGGMAAGERARRSEAFRSGDAPVMVATSAFTTGVDKPDVRWVVHVGLPDSPDAYLHEIGLAGRDGEPARALLLYRPEDLAPQRLFVGGAPDRAELARVIRALGDGPARRTDIAADLGLGTRRLAQDLALLERVGAAVTLVNGRVTTPPYAPPPDEAVSLALREIGRHQTVQKSRIDAMLQLAEAHGCRGQHLLAHFGERLARPCGHCDNCRRGVIPAPRRSAENVLAPA